MIQNYYKIMRNKNIEANTTKEDAPISRKYNKGGCPYFKKHPPLLIIYELHHTHTAHSWVSHCRCWIFFFLFRDYALSCKEHTCN